MEKSIKRVEKLVHVTNSALAQMKFSLMFDDMNGGGKVNAFDTRFGEKLADGDDLKQCQSEFKTEANEMFTKIENMFSSNDLARRNSKAVGRIKEINRRMNCLRLSKQSKPEATEESRQTFLNLINEEKFSPGASSSWDSVQDKHSTRLNREKFAEKPQTAPEKTASLLSVTKSPCKTKEELKKKILETQEIVNRGFQTARQLAQKVETMSKYDRREKTPSTDKTLSEINLRTLGGKTESNETLSTVKCKKSVKRRRKRDAEDLEQPNTRVINIKRKESEGRANLQVQRLPSVHIRGGLQLQKIHSLEIPAGGDASAGKPNTAVNVVSHEQMESEKMRVNIDKMRKENCCCMSNNPQGSFVECFNCGKLIKIPETCVDPQKVDEILEKCNFDVFDPRIDEFVEKYGADVSRVCRKKSQSLRPSQTNLSVDVAATEHEEEQKEIKWKKKYEKDSKRSCSTLQGLSDRLLKKYKQETETIENSHLKLDNILQNLFRQIDESREVFEKCHLFREKKSGSGLERKLTVTKPVLVSLVGTSCRRSKKTEKVGKEQTDNVDNCWKTKRDVQKVEPESPFKGGVSSVYQSQLPSHPGRRKPDRKRKTSGRSIPSSSSHSTEKLSEMETLEGGGSSVTSPSTTWSFEHSRNVSGIEDALLSPNSQRKAKLSDRIYRKEESQRKFFATSKNEAVKKPETRKEKVEEEKAPSDNVSSSSSKSIKSSSVEDRISESGRSKCSFGKDETERKMVVTSSSKSEGKVPSEASSEKSENNYESDFESMTNEHIENADECEEEEPEGNLGINKLSTISEVDSELEKKLSDDQKTARSSSNAEADGTPKTMEAEATDVQTHVEDVTFLVQREDESVLLRVNAEDKKTESPSPKTAEASAKSTPTELVTSLRDILSALQDQFVRTESLAEKLTENVKLDRPRQESDVVLLGSAMLSSWKKPIAEGLVENLRNARKDSICGQNSGTFTEERGRKSAEQKVDSVDSLSDEGGSSLGEIIVSNRRRKSSVKSGSSSISECSFLRLDSARSAMFASGRREANAAPVFKLDVNTEEILYSEGEIPSDEMLAFERFGRSSVGEVIIEKNSASTID